MAASKHLRAVLLGCVACSLQGLNEDEVSPVCRRCGFQSSQGDAGLSFQHFKPCGRFCQCSVTASPHNGSSSSCRSPVGVLIGGWDALPHPCDRRKALLDLEMHSFGRAFGNLRETWTPPAPRVWSSVQVRLDEPGVTSPAL